MDLFESRHYKINLSLFSLFGQVPAFTVVPPAITIPFFVLLFSANLFFQLSKVYVEGFNVPVLLGVAPEAISMFLSLVFIPIHYSNRKKQRTIFAVIMDDWKENRPKEEMEIKQSHTELTKLLVVGNSMFVSSGMSTILTWGFTPQMLDIIFPLNESRPRELVLLSEYFIDEEKYFYSLLFFQLVSVAAVVILIGATENTFVIVIQHIHSMLDVLGYRLENVMQVEGSVKRGTAAEEVVAGKLDMCLQEHRKIIQLCQDVSACCNACLFLGLAGTVACISISLVEITNTELITLKTVLFTSGHIVHFFIISCLGQRLIDKSLDISYYAYNARWYDGPVRIQKLIVMIILRSYRPCSIIAANFYILSLESFAAFAQLAMSYFMVLRQVVGRPEH